MADMDISANYMDFLRTGAAHRMSMACLVAQSGIGMPVTHAHLRALAFIRA
jgi:hypothetical protein